jgi:hypothetical protein
MKGGAVVRGGVLGGVLGAIVVGSAGRMLGVAIPPWTFSSTAGGTLGRAIDWSWSVAAVAPLGIVLGVVTAFVCALAFEYLTHRSGWLLGGVIGLLLGVAGAVIVGLIPWAASWYSYAYTPSLPPLGVYDTVWPLAAVAVAGAVAGAAAGACYGVPRRASEIRRTFGWRELEL